MTVGGLHISSAALGWAQVFEAKVLKIKFSER